MQSVPEPCLCGDPHCKRCFPYCDTLPDTAYCDECEEWADEEGDCPSCGEKLYSTYEDIQGAKADEAYDRLKERGL
uniref:Uncharacterized protein n=1 Tax=viral metagenome TaxID=1070528 RepID=A0A6M3JRP9_9ZZZZ